MAPRRPQLHGHVSLEARAGWSRFARLHGTTVSGLLEVLGRRLETMDEPDKLNREWRLVVKAARQVDAERRQRHSLADRP